MPPATAIHPAASNQADTALATLAMALAPLARAGVEPLTLAQAVHTQQRSAPHMGTLWAYYRNPMSPRRPSRAGKPYALAQQRGLPLRLTSPSQVGVPFDDRAGLTREIVIENDIAWRIGAMIDFLFGKPVRIVSAAADPALARRIEAQLERVIESSGGLAMLQEAALLGHVYGSVDLLVHAPAPGILAVTPVDPTRAVPIIADHDWRTLTAYAVLGPPTPAAATAADHAPGPQAAGAHPVSALLEVLTPARRVLVTLTAPHAGALYHAASIRADEPAAVTPGAVPVAHVQNVGQPFAYHGLGEVEPLIPLQDELNTRLSDRANRVTMQSFKMYLAKGVDGFDRAPVGPGVLLSTDNPDAAITTFGGDAASPSEDRHIDELREALDKISGVPPLATGVVRAKVGNLSSENALRLTLQGLVARTARKRITYGRGIARVCQLILAALDHHGLLATAPIDRDVRVEWPDPLTTGQAELIATAQAKRELGVPTGTLLTELGYASSDPGVQ